MEDRIYSLETEYGLTHLPVEGQVPLPPAEIFEILAGALDPGLKAPGSEVDMMFLKNGAKFYDDEGHPEWACPECLSAGDAMLWDKAGERLLAHIGEKAEKRITGQILLTKNNVDPQEHYYGCHENYLVERKPDFAASEEEFLLLLVRYLLPFLVTRQIYAGAGKVGWFKSAKKPKFAYQISQRADAIERIASPDTRIDRAIINTRDESLGDELKYRRLHLILGDSNLSEWASLMKLGTTGIVLRLIEDNYISEDLVLDNPLKAIREISYDPKCRRSLALKNGKFMTAIEIQGRYLAMARAYFEYTAPDKEEQFILTQWEDALQKLNKDPASLSDRVDWVSKKQALERYMVKNDYSWQDPRVRELDLKYHDINPNRGLYYQLDESGKISTLLENKEIRMAEHEPPHDTRANIRCDSIRAANRWGMDLKVDWDKITIDGKTISLDDPLEYYNQEVDTLLANGQALGFFKEMVTHPNLNVRKKAVSQLGQLDDEMAFGILAQAMMDNEWQVRSAAIEVIAKKSAARIADLAKQALDDPCFAVRRRAAEVLRRLR